jgi:hypothetical protein
MKAVSWFRVAVILILTGCGFAAAQKSDVPAVGQGPYDTIELFGIIGPGDALTLRRNGSASLFVKGRPRSFPPERSI